MIHTIRTISILLLLAASLSMHAQTTEEVVADADSLMVATDSLSLSLTARVVDKKTGEPLPFASVYISGERNTITNAVGEFSISAAPDDILRISYVGYYSVRLRASEIGGTVPLESEGKMLSEVVVYSADHVIKETLRRCKKEMSMHRKEKSNFFYRQISYVDRQCTIFLESFMTGRTAGTLSGLSLQTGRFVAVASSETFNPTNFYTFAEVDMYKEEEGKGVYDIVPPLTKNYKKYFYTEMEMMRDGEKKIYVIYFIPRKEKLWTVNCCLYIDGETYRVLKYEGETLNTYVCHRTIKNSEVLPIAHTFVVNFNTEKGFSEVHSVSYNTRYVREEKVYETSAVMFNVGNRYLSKEEKKKEKKDQEELASRHYYNSLTEVMDAAWGDLHFNGNLINSINKQGVDKEFWKKNEIVKRTPIEQKAVEIFEHDNLFGVF